MAPGVAVASHGAAVSRSWLTSTPTLTSQTLAAIPMGTCTTRSVTLTLTRPRCRTGPPSWIVTTEEGSALAVHGAVPSVSSSTNTATFRSHTFAARATGTWTETSVRLTLTSPAGEGGGGDELREFGHVSAPLQWHLAQRPSTRLSTETSTLRAGGRPPPVARRWSLKAAGMGV